MDFIKPNFVVVNKRCFRSFYSRTGEPTYSKSFSNYEPEDEYADEPIDKDDGDDYECLEFEQDNNGNFVLSLTVSPEFYGMIIGFKGQNLSRLESSTKCRIVIPKRDDSSSRGKTISLKAPSKRNIVSAKRKILAIVDKSRSRLEPNYFISIPIDDADLIERYKEFKYQVLSEASKNPIKYPGICEEIFQDPGRMHLTICMLLILDQSDEKNQVIKILEKVYQDKIVDIVRGKKLMATVRGLAYMNDDINAVDVLYGKIESNDDLQKIADLIVDQFKDTLFISRERAKVVFHLTLLNSKFKLDKEEREGWLKDRKKDKREKFSVKEMMDKFGSYYFGEIQIKSIELSIRHTKNEKGYYKSALTLNLDNVS